MHDKFAIYSGSHLRREHTRTRTAAKFSTGSFFAFFVCLAAVEKVSPDRKVLPIFLPSRDKLNKSASLLCFFSLLIFRLFDHLDEITSDVKKSPPNKYYLQEINILIVSEIFLLFFLAENVYCAK